MEEQYYTEIKNLIENYEVNARVRMLQDNSEKLQMNWNIGRLLVEAQGGSKRAKYGDNLINKWGNRLFLIYGKSYGKELLRRCRLYYLYFPKSSTMSSISWSHIVELLSLKNENERTYYINQVILNHLSVKLMIDYLMLIRRI